MFSTNCSFFFQKNPCVEGPHTTNSAEQKNEELLNSSQETIPGIADMDTCLASTFQGNQKQTQGNKPKAKPKTILKQQTKRVLTELPVNLYSGLEATLRLGQGKYCCPCTAQQLCSVPGPLACAQGSVSTVFPHAVARGCSASGVED